MNNDKKDKKQRLYTPDGVFAELINNIKNAPKEYKEDVEAVAYLAMEDSGPRAILPLLNVVLLLQQEIVDLRKSNNALANLIADKL